MNDLIHIGIDPGNTGALVALLRGQPIEWLLMPTISLGTNTRVNAAAVSAWLRDFDAPRVRVHLEQVGPMPGNSGTGMFTFGHAAGVVHGVVAGLGLPLDLVTPQKWKKAAGLSGSDKDAARSKAVLLWPSWRDLDKKAKGQALADAALLAKFGSEASA